MSLDHKFVNGKHFFESFEHSQFLTIMVDAHCSCNAQTWTKGLICYHLQNCLQYLWMKPKDRLKVKFGNTSLERKNTVLGLVGVVIENLTRLEQERTKAQNTQV